MKSNKQVRRILLWVYVSIVVSAVLAFFLTCMIEGNVYIGALVSTKYGLMFLLCMGIIWLVVLMYYHKHYWLFNSKNIIKGKKTDESIDVKLENSKFMTDGEVKKEFRVEEYSSLKNLEIIGSVIAADEEDGNMKVTFADATHNLIIGTTGSGKTTTYVNNTIQILKELKNRPSMIISDPKGELFRDHSKSLKERGYTVVVLDLRNPYHSARWNPLESIYEKYKLAHNLEELYEVDEENGCYYMEGKCYHDYSILYNNLQVKKQLLLDTVYEDLNDICQVLCPVKNTSEPMWESGAKSLILAVCLAMLEDSLIEGSSMTKDKFNFYSIMKVCTKTENNCKHLLDYFKGRSPLSQCVSLANQVLDTSDKTRGSYLSTVFDKITMFADMGLSAITSKSEIRFEDMADRPTAVFLKIPDEKETRHTLASLMILQAYKALVYKSTLTPTLKLERPVYFILDEFGNLPKIEHMEQMLTVGRGRNIYINLIVQSFAQLNKVYDAETSDIIKGNCNIHIFIGTTDIKTREEFSKMLGNYTVMQRSVGFPSAKGEDINSNISVKERPLMYASELQLIPSGCAVVSAFRKKPFMAHFVPSYKANAYKLEPSKDELLKGRYFDEEKAYYNIEIRNELIARKHHVVRKMSSRDGMKRINLISEINFIMQDVLTLDEIARLENAIRELQLDEAIIILDRALDVARNQDNKEKISLIEEETKQIRDFIIQNKKIDFNNYLRN